MNRRISNTLDTDFCADALAEGLRRYGTSARIPVKLSRRSGGKCPPLPFEGIQEPERSDALAFHHGPSGQPRSTVAFVFLTDTPFKAILCALRTARSQLGCATVGSPTVSCHLEIGNWMAMIVEVRSCRSSRISSRSLLSASWERKPPIIELVELHITRYIDTC